MPSRQNHASISAQLKAKLNDIRKSLAKLEAQTSSGQLCSQKKLQIITQETEAQLNALEAQPLEKIARKLQKRQRRRRAEKAQRKQNHILKFPASKSTKVGATPAKETTQTPAEVAPSTDPIKPHQQLRNYKNAQRFLRSFELLKILHASRGAEPAETRAFAAQLDHMSAVWNTILQENTPSRTKERCIEDQWDEVFYGASEAVYYGSEQKMADFLRTRRIWDSYLVGGSKHGSSIPLGWVLPHAKPAAQWAKYQAQLNSPGQ